jgi:hypothetical protein
MLKPDSDREQPVYETVRSDAMSVGNGTVSRIKAAMAT